MGLNARQRADLVAAANRLKVSATIAPDAISETTIEHVRRCFVQRELIKIRMPTPDREEFRRAAAQLAEMTPCEVVQRLGRVVTLYRAGQDADDPCSDSASARPSTPQE